jgi:hypothetical protein
MASLLLMLFRSWQQIVKVLKSGSSHASRATVFPSSNISNVSHRTKANYLETPSAVAVLPELGLVVVDISAVKGMRQWKILP